MKYLILLLLIILRSFVRYLRNLVYVRKVKILEEVLDSKLHCTYGILRPIVKIIGIYKGRTIDFRSYTKGIWRGSMLILKSSKLPKQKKFMFDYPKVANNISQDGNMLVYRVFDLFTFKLSRMGKDGVTSILDELVDTADRIECAEE